MAPLSSANGMNVEGGNRPRLGCCQRTSASTPRTAPARELDAGLVFDDELPVGDRRKHVDGKCPVLVGRSLEERLVELDPVLARSLGGVHRHVGIVH